MTLLYPIGNEVVGNLKSKNKRATETSKWNTTSVAEHKKVKSLREDMSKPLHAKTDGSERSSVVTKAAKSGGGLPGWEWPVAAH